ncbi:MAG: Fe-S cluster assembly protein SufB [Fervidicoccaceae archaeon]|nr:Fe-S cluster assembly protein SufB [Fervidicoccaceae archaeon]
MISEHSGEKEQKLQLKKTFSGGIEEILGLATKYEKSFEIKGKISRELVEEISRIKKEPEWMKRLRLRALEMYEKLPSPKWIRGIEDLDVDSLIHYLKPEASMARSWDEIPKQIRAYYEKLGLPEIEQRVLSGLSLQFESETIYHNYKKLLEEKGVIMLPMEEAVNKYPDLVKSYFTRVFPFSEHKYAALHAALWSGGVFVYVPKNVKIKQPIEAFFLIGSAMEGQFEHTLIVADENSYIHFIEGCAAPIYKGYSFHDGMVELYAHRGAHIKFSTIQNWSSNVINFNNKRGIAEENAVIEWFEGSIGSRVTYVYPSTILKGDNSRTTIYTVTLNLGNKLKDTGSKVYMVGRNTSAKIVNKSVVGDGGINVYRGLIRVNKEADKAVVSSSCENLILDNRSKAYTYPHVQVFSNSAVINHEAKTGKLGENQLFYLMSRGLTEGEAKSLVVLGFLEEVLVDLPFEYASVLNKVIQLEFEKYGGIG